MTPTQARAATAALCATCTTTGRRGYCAPGRCYCGHDTCHAFASYTDLGKIALPPAPAAPARTSTTWTDRTSPTWIDNL